LFAHNCLLIELPEFYRKQELFNRHGEKGLRQKKKEERKKEERKKENGEFSDQRTLFAF